MPTDMQEIAVVTDSTADLPAALAEEHQITVVPAILTVNGQSFTDGRDFKRDELYNAMDTMEDVPTTAIPSPMTFVHAYRTLQERGVKQILSIHVSHKLSGMLNCANQAARGIGVPVHLIDSGQVSLGLGFQALELASRAREGASLAQLLALANQLKEKTRTVAGIDSLEFLRRSGRVSWLKAEIGLRLRLRLILEVVDGDVLRHSIVRTRKQVLQRLSAIAETWQPIKRLAVLHTGIPALADELVQSLLPCSRFAPFPVDVTTVIGAHVGPRSIGVAGLIE